MLNENPCRLKFNTQKKMLLGIIVPCIYHESRFIPWVNFYTMTSYLNHDSVFIPWIHVYTMRPCIYYESLSKPWLHVYTMSSCHWHESCTYHESRNSNNINTTKKWNDPKGKRYLKVQGWQILPKGSRLSNDTWLKIQCWQKVQDWHMVAKCPRLTKVHKGIRLAKGT